MRRIFLAVAFLILIAGLGLLWAHRFERVPGLPVWSLADLRAGVPEVSGVEWTGAADDPVLRLRVDGKTRQVAMRLGIPGAPPVDMLQLRYRMAARGLARGAEWWEGGRMMVEWHPPDGAGEIEEDPVGGVELDDRLDDVTLVAVPEHGPAVPALRLEHLGHAGEFELAGLEMIALRERGLWKIGRWFLACGWLFWIFGCIRSWPGVTCWPGLAAAVIWLLMGIHFIVPGPWKIQKPLGIGFQLGEPVQGEASSQAPPLVAGGEPPGIQSGAVAASGKLPVRGGLALRIKFMIAQARPLLHVLLLLAPALGSAWLVGRGPTLVFAVLTSLAIEAAQVAFGFGFDWVDVVDLLTDATGIALALWLARRFPWSGDLRIAGRE